jgi:nicotinate-nucleotide pyrophosphorylase (carboxylating)
MFNFAGEPPGTEEAPVATKIQRSKFTIAFQATGHWQVTMDWNNRHITAIVQNALMEDKATRDATTAVCIDAGQRGVATIRAKQDLVIAGLGLIERTLKIFAELEPAATGIPDVAINSEIFDGVRVRKGDTVAVIRHNARVLLSCERVILNFLQRLSGTATLARRYVDEIAGTKARILDTRKTVPGLRILDKYAVTCGGGFNHRLDLSDGILIKNNHIALAGGLKPALERAHRNRRGEQPIQAEVRNLQELEEALQAGAEAILLDNMSPEECRQAVQRVQRHTRRVPLEASGGINLLNVRAYAEAGVDFISIGALTHSPPAVDLNMRVQPL